MISFYYDSFKCYSTDFNVWEVWVVRVLVLGLVEGQALVPH
jgi:hypothetical protein